jgi:E3 ubiquitin-protein ligase DOA10
LKEAKEVAIIDTSDDSHHCRFCWGQDTSTENPIMTPCKCAGSVGLIHYDCLKRWLETKVNIKSHNNNSVKSYIWKTFECEICKSPYPYSFKQMDTLYKLFTVEKPTSANYLMLESLPLDKNSSRMIHVL